MKPLLAALARQPLSHPPVWVMRQAGRYLPEYRALRERHSFQEAVSTPAVAAEITLQPIRRFAMDGAVIFADIMTPLEAMGVDMTFAPGPKLRPHTLAEIAALPELDLDRVSFVAETIGRVGVELPDTTAVIGFCGAPMTLLAYLVEGGGSKDFLAFRGEVRRDEGAARAALDHLARAMTAYLKMQFEAGADVVQLFDSWAGLFDTDQYRRMVAPAAGAIASTLDGPVIYFAPGAGHALGEQLAVGAGAYGVDWRRPIDEYWDELGDVALQGNLDPAVLLTDPGTIKKEVGELIARVGNRTGHIVNLGHGIHRTTPPEHVQALVDAVRGG